MTFGQLLTKHRQQAGLKKTDLANKMGVSLGYIINLEAGRKKPPTIERIEQLIDVLSLSKKETTELLNSAAEERILKKDIRFLQADIIKKAAERMLQESFPPEAIPVKGFVKVPLLGIAPAGPKSFTQEEIEHWLSLPKELAKGKRLYLLRVVGDSMNETGIKKGSMIIVDADAQPENRDIVVIRIDGETTIKRFKKYDTVIVLTPESSNPVHKEQSYTNKNDIQLRGVVKGVWWA